MVGAGGSRIDADTARAFESKLRLLSSTGGQREAVQHAPRLGRYTPQYMRIKTPRIPGLHSLGRHPLPPLTPTPPLPDVPSVLLVQVDRRISQPNELCTALQNHQHPDLMAYALGNPIRNTRQPQDEIRDGVHVQEKHLPDLAVDFGLGVWAGGTADGQCGDGWLFQAFLEID